MNTKIIDAEWEEIIEETVIPPVKKKSKAMQNVLEFVSVICASLIVSRLLGLMLYGF